MSKNPLVRCVSRLLTLAVMLGALAILVSTQKVQAVDDPYTCNTQWGYCLFLCAPKTGSQYDACRANCEVNLLSCESNDPYETLPAPYPVINHDYSNCLAGCAQCNNIDDFMDANDCYNTCYDYCWNTYRGAE